MCVFSGQTSWCFHSPASRVAHLRTPSPSCRQEEAAGSSTDRTPGCVGGSSDARVVPLPTCRPCMRNRKSRKRSRGLERMTERGPIQIPIPTNKKRENLFLIRHVAVGHTFFSSNGESWSPMIAAQTNTHTHGPPPPVCPGPGMQDEGAHTKETCKRRKTPKRNCERRASRSPRRLSTVVGVSKTANSHHRAAQIDRRKAATTRAQHRPRQKKKSGERGRKKERKKTHKKTASFSGTETEEEDRGDYGARKI